jgi:hypothetical protein
MENAFDEVRGTLFPKSTTEGLNILQQHLWLSVRIALLFLSVEADILREAVYVPCKILSFQSGFAKDWSLCNKIPWGMAQSYRHFGGTRYLHSQGQHNPRKPTSLTLKKEAAITSETQVITYRSTGLHVLHNLNPKVVVCFYNLL